MESCGACRNFLHHSFRFRGHEGRPKFVCSLEERQRIRESAEDCQLCDRIYHFLEAHYESAFDLPDSDDPWFKMEACTRKSRLYDEQNQYSSIRFFWDGIGINHRYGNLEFSIWEDEESSGPDPSSDPVTIESPAPTSLVTRPPIIHGSQAEMNTLVRRFLNNCLDHHDSCRLSPPEEELKLPSRVLSVKDDAGKISVKLVENDGLRGRYCALSHCWGPEGKRPLRTLLGNLTHHLASIAWDKLPATFRETITLTRGLGIEYLWIDSLCIIQDDKEDWLKESKKMASIYRRATLVVAAVSSEDSSQGLSGTERLESLTFRVPYSTEEEPPRGGYNVAASLISGDDIVGPLKERAWAFQEWYLGRRKVFFTSEGIKWKCDELECNENGNDIDLELYETQSWFQCLEEYTRRRLTVPSDRLFALLGIAAENQKFRNDSFVPEFGVWEDKLAEQLLWRPTGTNDEDVPSLPSWCWAATGGQKMWLLDLLDHSIHSELAVKILPKVVSLRKSGSVHVLGLLIRSKVASLPLPECCIRSFNYITNCRMENPSKSSPEKVLFPGYTLERCSIRRFAILNPTGACKILGIALFDRDKYFSECFCFILSSTTRQVWEDPCHPNFEEGPSNSEEDSSIDIEESCNALEESSVEDSDDNSDVEYGSFSHEQNWQPEIDDSSRGFEESDVEDGGDGNDDSSVEESEDSHLGYAHTDSCVDIFTAARSEEVYWALLLQPVDDTEKRFTRVGVAVLWPRALQTGGGFAELEIV
ncbi:heterokaryon incompatibility protein-domain-containing protein [Colletotrichum cereale]|nr:heterokaryon incompatibility protein-domain-containing protein [Colletotrichum cereale]